MTTKELSLEMAGLMKQIMPGCLTDLLLRDDSATGCSVFDATHINSAHENLTPLHYAALAGSAALVDFLIEAGADVHAVTPRQDTACHLAAPRGHDDALLSLHRAGASVDSTNRASWSPVHCAAFGGHVTTVRLLHSLGADTQRSIVDGTTALHCAARGGHVEVIDFLTSDSRCDVNKASSYSGWTPLISAAYEGHTDAVKLLHSRGADVNHRTPEGLTAMHYAAGRDYIDLLRLLTSIGAHLDSPSNEGATPLVHAAISGYIQSVQYLHSCGANINAVDKRGRSVFYHAVSNGHVSVSTFLASVGCDTRRRANDGTDPAEMAGNWHVVVALFEAGAFTDADDVKCSATGPRGWPICVGVCGYVLGNEEFVCRLAKAGVSFRRRTVEGLLPWHVAEGRPLLRVLHTLDADCDGW